MIPVATALALLAAMAGGATADENQPYVVTNEWSGFLECGVGTAAVSVALCSLIDSPNEAFLHHTNVTAGIETVVIGMDWDPVGGLSNSELELFINTPNDEIRISGPPPLEVRIDDLPSGGGELRLRVFASTDTVAVVYQQPFTVYHDHFYHEAAPEGYSALPTH